MSTAANAAGPASSFNAYAAPARGERVVVGGAAVSVIIEDRKCYRTLSNVCGIWLRPHPEPPLNRGMFRRRMATIPCHEAEDRTRDARTHRSAQARRRDAADL